MIPTNILLVGDTFDSMSFRCQDLNAVCLSIMDELIESDRSASKAHVQDHLLM